MARDFSNFGIPPTEQILGIGSQNKVGGDLDVTGRRVSNKNIALFYNNAIRIFLDERRKQEDTWGKARHAFRGDVSTAAFSAVDALFQGTPERFVRGLPYAAVMTTTAALTPNRANFNVDASRESARDKAVLSRVLLNNKWSSDERQWLQEKAVNELQIFGYVVGFIGYETNYQEWEKKLEAEQKRLEERAALSQEERFLDEAVDFELAAELGPDNSPKPLRGEADHTGRWEEVYARIISPYDYVCDPDAENMVNGPRWEGRRIRMRLVDLQNNPRYKRAVRMKVKPTRFTRNGGSGEVDSVRDRRRNSVTFKQASMPASHQIVEVYEIYDYTDPDFADQGGALISFVLGMDDLLERRVNPYGRRPYVVEEVNGMHDDLFPQSDFNPWEDLWYAFQDIFYRFIRQLRKAPNTTLMIDQSAEGNNRDEIEGLISGDDGGIAWLDFAGKPAAQVIQELRTAQVSGEYINALNFILQMIRITIGLGPNQLGGAPLKSETSATEAAEIGRFTRSRLQLKENALNRFMNKMARNWLATLFRFVDLEDIQGMVESKLVDAASFDASRVNASTLADIDIEVEAGSMAADAMAQKIQKMQLLLQLLQSDPQLAVRLNREAEVAVANDILRLNTGEDMFLAEDSEGFQLNLALQQMLSGQRGTASPPRQPSGGNGNVRL